MSWEDKLEHFTRQSRILGCPPIIFKKRRPPKVLLGLIEALEGGSKRQTCTDYHHKTFPIQKILSVQVTTLQRTIRIKRIIASLAKKVNKLLIFNNS